MRILDIDRLDRLAKDKAERDCVVAAALDNPMSIEFNISTGELISAVAFVRLKEQEPERAVREIIDVTIDDAGVPTVRATNAGHARGVLR